MKIKIYLSIIFLILFLSPGIAQSDIVKEVLDASNAGYVSYLEQIPNGQESFFGFNNRAEFALAKIGKPYQVFILTKEFFIDTLLSDKNYLQSTNEWRVEITVSGENRLLITVANMNGSWQAVGIGSVVVAKELGEFETKYPSTKQEGMLLRVYQPYSEFVLASMEKSSRVVPLQSAKISFSKISESSSWSLAEALTMIKNKITNK